MTVPQRVVILNDSSVAKGGATGLAILSAKLMQGAGYEVHFISGDAGDESALKDAGVQLHALGGALLLDRPKLAAATPGLYNSGLRDRISQILAELDGPGTVYHLHGWSRILTASVFDALKPVASRCYIHAHDYFLACPNGGNFHFNADRVCTKTPMSLGCLSSPCDKRSNGHKAWRAVRHAVMFGRFSQSLPWAGILAIHPGMVPVLKRAGYADEKVGILRNPIVPFTKDRIPAEENSQFAFVGRIEHGKGVETLCAAVDQAKVALTIIGEGSLRAELQAKHPSVQFTGWQSHEQIATHLRTMRAIVMPTRQPEPFGLVAAEASRSGLPVIMSDRGLIAQDIKNGGLGMVYDANDPNALKDSLVAFSDLNSAQVQAISEHAFAGQAELSLTPEAWGNALLSLYSETLK